MTNLILPSRLTKQPQSWIPLDLNHPLLERVVIATTVFDGKLRNLLSPDPGASIGTHASGVASLAVNGNEGLVGLVCPSTSLGYINLGAFSPTGSEATLLGLIGYGGSGTSRIFLGTKSGDTGTGIGIGLNTASALNGRFHDTSAVQQSTGTVSRLNGGVFPFALTVRADQGNFYFNNQVATPVSATFDSTSLAGSQNLYVARDGGTYRGARVVMVLALDREVSLPEYQDWMQNPWQIFQPDKRILYFSVSSGGRTGTLAATETGSDTASISGDVLVKGALAATESGADSAALAGKVLVKGALSASESGADTAALAGDVLVKGALAASESGNDSASFIGEGFVPTATGALAASESGSDTASIAGKVYIAGTLSAVEGGLDGFAASGNILVQGTLAASETGDDTAAFVQETLTLTPADLNAIAAAVWADPAAVAAHAKLDEIIARITC